MIFKFFIYLSKTDYKYTPKEIKKNKKRIALIWDTHWDMDLVERKGLKSISKAKTTDQGINSSKRKIKEEK